MKNVITNAQNLIVRIDAYLDYFWIGVVLVAIHRQMARLYRNHANYVQDMAIAVTHQVPRERLEILRHKAKRHTLEAKLIREMFV